MTIKKRILIEPKDIVGIEYECKHCLSTFSVIISAADRQILNCPNCNETWMERGKTPVENRLDVQKMFYFKNYLGFLQQDICGATIRLEIVLEEKTKD